MQNEELPCSQTDGAHAARRPAGNSPAAPDMPFYGSPQDRAFEHLSASLASDHERVRRGFHAFARLDVLSDPGSAAIVVKTVCADIARQIQLERELLFPAARTAPQASLLLEEALARLDAMAASLDQLDRLSWTDDDFATRFNRLGELVERHVHAERDDLLPLLERHPLDWTKLLAQWLQRRAELIRRDTPGRPPEAIEHVDVEGAQALPQVRSTVGSSSPHSRKV